MLELLYKCPVTVDRLKQTDTAKVVKQLVKAFDPAAPNAAAAAVAGSENELLRSQVFHLAGDLVKKWKTLISGSAASLAEAAAANSVPSENGSNVVSGSTAATAGTKVKKVSVRKNSSDATVNVNGSSSNSVTVNGGSDKQGLANTVAHSNSTNKVKSGSSISSSTTTSTTTGGPDGGDDSNSSGAMVTSPSASSVTLTPSDLFMNAMNAAAEVAVSETPKRKKKLSSSSSDTNENPHKRPKTMSTTTNSSSDGTTAIDPLDDTLSKMIEQDMSQQAPSFTRSVSNDLPITPPPVNRSPSMTTTMTSSGPFTTPTTSTPIGNNRTMTGTSGGSAFETPATSSSSDMITSDEVMTPGPDKSFPRGCLHYSTPSSSSKKKVRWLPDQSMTRVKFFDSSEDERVNVFRQQMQDQMNAESKQAEAHAFRDRSGGSDGNTATGPASDTSNNWPALQVIDGIEQMNTVVRGRDSLEKNIEQERQSRTLADIYVSRQMCPETPAEPDPPGPSTLQSIPLSSFVIIPLDDPVGGTVEDWSRQALPVPHNNPLFGETFLQPHQMELDVRHVGSAFAVHANAVPYASNPIPAAGPNVAMDPANAAPAAASAGAGGGYMFASSYEQRPFTAQPNNNNNINNRGGGGGRGGGRGHNNYNNRNNNDIQFRPGAFLPDLRDAQNRKVCTYFFKTGACSRNPCKFVHTRDAINWNK